MPHVPRVACDMADALCNGEATEFRTWSCVGGRLYLCVSSHACRTPDVAHFPAGHAPSDVAQWLDGVDAGNTGSSTYKVDYAEYYEPYVVACRRQVPLYDERFRGYGLNKISHLLHMHMVLHCCCGDGCVDVELCLFCQPGGLMLCCWVVSLSFDRLALSSVCCTAPLW